MHQKNVTIQRPAYFGEPSHWVLNGLTKFTILFGKNGSGKSVIMRLWRNQDIESCHYVVPERGGQLSYQANLLDTIQTATGRRNHTNDNQAPQYRDQVITRMGAYFTARGAYLPPAGSACAEVHDFPPERIRSSLSSLFPDFEISVKSDPPYLNFVRLDTGEEVTTVQNLSSGEAQIITLAIDIISIIAMWVLKNQKMRILLIDEPDAHIHPDLQARFAGFIVSTANECDVQVIIATHSTTLLSAIGASAGEDASVIFLNRARSEYQASQFGDVHRDLTACLGGNLLMGPLFGSPLLLVEGDDDQKIWSQVPRHHVIDIAVMPCTGDTIKRYQAILDKLFSSLLGDGDGTVGFALLVAHPVPWTQVCLTRRA